MHISIFNDCYEDCFQGASIEIRSRKKVLAKAVIQNQNRIEFNFPMEAKIQLYTSCNDCNEKCSFVKQKYFTSVDSQKYYIYVIDNKYCCNKCRMTSKLIR